MDVTFFSFNISAFDTYFPMRSKSQRSNLDIFFFFFTEMELSELYFTRSL